MRIAIALSSLVAFGGCQTGLSIETPDAAPDLVSSGDVNRVVCAPSTCATSGGDVCCVAATGDTCQAPPCAAGAFVSLACDGPEDCAGLQCCYLVAANQILCQASCGTDYRICHSNADCGAGQCCLQLEASAPVSGCVTSTSCPD